MCNPPRHWPHARRAFSPTDVFWYFFIIALLLSILLPSLSRARELSKRSVCAANLRGLGTACQIYANENQDAFFPTAPYRFPKRDVVGNEHPVSFIGRIGADMTKQLTAETNDKASVTRSTFMLVIAGGSTCGQFICPSSGDTGDWLRNGPPGRQIAAQPGVNRFDFAGYNNTSYGYQLPFGRMGQPRQACDPRMALMADKGPYFEAAPPNAEGNAADQLVAGQQAPAFDDPNVALTASNEQWRPYNSRNHGTEGQVVLYADTHVEFLRKPIVGVNNDNIYTQQTDYTLAAILIGAKPQDRKGPFTNTDSVIVP